jgi:mono/diheme cytochrome c family protein
VKPDIPVVAAYKARRKIPVWAMATLSILPVWMFMYLLALTPTEAKAAGPLGVGAEVYGGAGNCAGCHGAAGAGSKAARTPSPMATPSSPSRTSRTSCAG